MISKHLTPAMFAAETRKLSGQVPFIAVHIKPRFYDQVVAELRELLELPDIQVGTPGGDLCLLSRGTLLEVADQSVELSSDPSRVRKIR